MGWAVTRAGPSHGLGRHMGWAVTWAEPSPGLIHSRDRTKRHQTPDTGHLSIRHFHIKAWKFCEDAALLANRSPLTAEQDPKAAACGFIDFDRFVGAACFGAGSSWDWAETNLPSLCILPV